MNTLCVAFFVGMVAVAHASVIGLGAAGVDSAAVLAGPSGTVTRAGLGVGVVGPAIGGLGLGVAGIGIGAPAVGLAAPLVSQGAVQRALELSVPAGSGLEGQWIPDINEKLYDDGSYKPLLGSL